MAYRNYSVANGLIVDPSGNGDFKTISPALNSAIAGDTIFIRDGVYTENLTAKAGVSLTAFLGDQNEPNVTIIGNITFTGAGSFNVSNIRLQTNSANIVTVSGSAASVVTLSRCYLNCTNNSGISFSSSSATSSIVLNNCSGDLGTTGINLFASTSAGNLSFQYSSFTNSGASTTANTISAGSLNIFASAFKNPISSSGTAAIGIELADITTTAQNVIALTSGGSGNAAIINSAFASGTASAISVTTATTLNINIATINSSNTNAITGAGTLGYSNISFVNSKTINTTTQSGGTIAGSTGNASIPSAGYLGERISAVQATAGLSTTAPTTMTSISLSPGVWDLSALGNFTYTGLSTISLLNISTTTNTIVGNSGDAYAQMDITLSSSSIISLCVPVFRVTLAASATYFLVGEAVFSTGTCTVSCRLSAVRVA
jgi:trimeric autotransporter adhesin